jgi:hypothetical protein
MVTTDRDIVIEQLEYTLKKGDTLYLIQRSKSIIEIYAMVDNKPVVIGHLVAFVLGYKYLPDKGGIRIKRNDDPENLAYQLSKLLFFDGCYLEHKWL